MYKTFVKRILGMSGQPAVECPNDQDKSSRLEQEAKSLRDEMLDDADFRMFAEKTAAERGLTVEVLADTQIEALYEAWSRGTSNGQDEKTLLHIGVAVLAAVAMMPGYAHASIGDEIAKKIIEKIQPFIEQLMATAMSALGLDIDEGAQKQAAAIGKSTDALIEVQKTIYNMEAARDAAPAANECSSPENAKRTVQAEQSAKNRTASQVEIQTAILAEKINNYPNPADRNSVTDRGVLAAVYAAGGAQANQTPESKTQAITRVAKPLDLTGQTKYSSSDRSRIDAHMQLLFAQTEKKIVIPAKDVNPATRDAIIRGADAMTTAQYSRQIIEKNIANCTETDDGESVMSMLKGSVDAEYANDRFTKSVQAITRPAPLLKTLINQQALANKIALKQLENSQDMSTLLALQLKELIKQNS